MNLQNITLAIPTGKKDLKYPFLYYELVKRRIEEIDKPAFLNSTVNREYSVCSIIINTEEDYTPVLKKSLRRKLNTDEINIEKINAEINIYCNVGKPYAEDRLFQQFFPSPMNKKLYNKIEKDINLKEIKKNYEDIASNPLIVRKKLKGNKIITSGDNFIEKTEFIIKDHGIKKIKSPFKTNYLYAGFLLSNSISDRVRSFLLSAYYDLLFKRELMYRDRVVYNVKSRVLPLSGGIFIDIIFSGFDEGDKVENRLLSLLDKKVDIPVEYIRNRAVSRLYRNLDEEKNWGKEYIKSELFQYKIKEIAKRIKGREKLKREHVKNIIGIITI